MYAIVETGGKQYRVQAGDFLTIEKVDGDIGSSYRFDDVLLVANGDEKSPKVLLGTPKVDGAFVEGQIVGQGRGKKTVVFKKKRRKNYARTAGHRQYHTQVLITGISGSGDLKASLSDSDKKTKLAKFSTGLKPKGPARTAKTLGSRKKMKAKNAPAKAKAPKKEAAAKAPAKKTTAKKTAAKKTAAKK